MKRLLAGGAKLDERNRHGMSALMLAAEAGAESVVAVLLEAGADRNLRNSRREMASDIAAAAGHERLAKTLK